MDKITKIKKMISDLTGVPSEDFGNKSRKSEYVLSRQFLVCALMHYNKMTDEKAGTYINRDRATVIHAMKDAELRCSTDKDYKSLYDDIIYKAGIIYNGQEVVKETPREKELNKEVKRLEGVIETMRTEIVWLKNEIQLYKRKYSFSQLEDRFSR